VEWLVEVFFEVVGWCFWRGDDQEWSILKISIWLAIVVLVILVCLYCR
jgi:hypothetical protein